MSDTSAAAEVAAPPPCGECRGPLGASYFKHRGRPICSGCRDVLQKKHDEKPDAPRLKRAALFGASAAAAGAVAYWAASRGYGEPIPLAALPVGFAVGMAVDAGGRGLAGLPFQVLGSVLCYLSIVGGYLLLGASFGEAWTAPFTRGLDVWVNSIIMAIAFYTAWILNQRGPFKADGPFAAEPPKPAA